MKFQYKGLTSVYSDDKYFQFYFQNDQGNVLFRIFKKTEFHKLNASIQDNKRIQFLHTFSPCLWKKPQENYAPKIIPKQFDYMCQNLEKALFLFFHTSWHEVCNEN